VAFAPGGKTLVTGCQDDALRFWDAATGKELRRLKSPERNASAVAFSPDGKLVATWSVVSGRISLWDVARLKETRAIRTWHPGVECVAFSPDGKGLVSAGGSSLVLWDVATGARRWHVQGGYCLSYQVEFAPDGRTLACGGQDGKIRLFDAATGKELRRFAGHGGSVYAVAFAPGGRVLASRGHGDVRLWEADSGKQLARLEVDSPSACYALAFSPDGRTLASSSHTSVILWEVLTGRRLGLLDGHKGGVCALAFSPDGRLLASGSADESALLRDWARVVGLHRDGRAKFGPQQYKGLWKVLAGDDIPAAYRSVADLAAAGDEAVSFLKGKVRPAADRDGPVIRKLIADLDHRRFSVREKASRELKKLGARARTSLEAVLAGKPGLELRRRVEQLLADIDSGKPSPEEVRHARAVWVLEKARTPAARRLLEELARGAPHALLTREAKAALARFRKPPP
jgi:WD40 repeat protein